VSPLELVRRNIDTSRLQRLRDPWLDSPDAIAADFRASARFTRVFLKLFSSEGFASPVLVAAPKSLSVTQRMHFRFENTSAAAAPRAPHSLTACAASCWRKLERSTGEFKRCSSAGACEMTSASLISAAGATGDKQDERIDYVQHFDFKTRS
jgi:hypothetical protein